MKKTIIFVVVLAVVVLLIFSGARQIQKSKAVLPKSISQLQAEKGIPVEVSEVIKDMFTLSRAYLGSVEGVLQGDVVAAVAERIVEIPVKVGDRVQKGQVVCRVDTRAALAQYNQLKLAYEDAVREAERMKSLYDGGAVSKQMLEKTELNRNISEQNLKSSSEVVSITAPISGVVTDIFQRIGETTEVGEAVARIADLSKVRIKFNANSDDRHNLNLDSPVFIRMNAAGQQEIAGKIVEISLSADPQNRLFAVWVEAGNSDISLKPGLLVDLRVVVLQKPDAIQVPRDAVITRNEQPGVFIVGADQKAIFTPIQKGAENSNALEVRSGLQPGQQVVVFGQNNLSDGQLVSIVK